MICEVLGGQQAGMKFDPQPIKPSSTPSCKANTDGEIRSDNVDVINANANMPDYFRSSTDREVDKGVSWALTQRIHSEFSDVFFQELGVLKAHLDYK